MMHDHFVNLLHQYTIDEDLIEPLKMQLVYTYQQMTQEQEVDNTSCKLRLAELKSKVETIEERFALGEIDRGIYQKVIAKQKKELESTQKHISTIPQYSMSNLENFLDNSLKLACNLRTTWELADSPTKKQLQKVLFPQGISYNRETDQCRTPMVNNFLGVINKLSASYKGGEMRKVILADDFSHWVAPMCLMSNPKLLIISCL